MDTKCDLTKNLLISDGLKRLKLPGFVFVWKLLRLSTYCKFSVKTFALVGNAVHFLSTWWLIFDAPTAKHIWIWSNADVCRCWKYNPSSKWFQTSQFHWWKKMILTCLCLCHETNWKAITHNLIALLIHALKCHGPASRQLATVLGIPKNLGHSVTVRWVASTCATGSLCQKRPWTQNVI